jgi:uncharacterized protein YndB with AHSA1/START domain
MNGKGAKKRGTMKIDKEVAITASTADVWSFLTDEKTLASIWGEKVLANIKKNGTIKFTRRKTQQKVKSVRPKEHLSLSLEGESASLTTTYRLTPRGNRTMLKVTITGWDSMEQERVRREVPRVSLEWEKRLGRIKRTLEAKGGSSG